MPDFAPYCRCPGCGECTAAIKARRKTSGVRRLTDEQIAQIANSVSLACSTPGSDEWMDCDQVIIDFARAILRAQSKGEKK